MSGIALVVRSEFEQYARGARITDEAEIARVTAEHPDKVAQVAAEPITAAQPDRPIKAKGPR